MASWKCAGGRDTKNVGALAQNVAQAQLCNQTIVRQLPNKNKGGGEEGGKTAVDSALELQRDWIQAGL